MLFYDCESILYSTEKYHKLPIELFSISNGVINHYIQLLNNNSLLYERLIFKLIEVVNPPIHVYSMLYDYYMNEIISRLVKRYGPSFQIMNEYIINNVNFINISGENFGLLILYNALTVVIMESMIQNGQSFENIPIVNNYRFKYLPKTQYNEISRIDEIQNEKLEIEQKVNSGIQRLKDLVVSDDVTKDNILSLLEEAYTINQHVINNTKLIGWSDIEDIINKLNLNITQEDVRIYHDNLDYKVLDKLSKLYEELIESERIKEMFSGFKSAEY